MDCKCETCVRTDCKERTKQDDLRIVINCYDYLERKPTTADRIRAMSDEELAEHEVRITRDGMYYECSDGETFAIYEDAIAHEIKRLKQPAEEEPHE